MKDKRKNAVSIIGGADGPTSIFIAGRSGKRPLKVRIRSYIHKYKRNKAEKKIAAGAHTLEEVVAYAMEHYGAAEVNTNQRIYIEQRKYLKESLILQHKPELLGEMKDISKPDVSSEASVREFWDQLEKRREMIAEIPDSEIAMDFHIYEIKIDDDCLEMVIDYTWNIFGISYSGKKQAAKQFKKISQDLYIYYGVSEDDIRKKSKRYSALLAALSR